MESNACHLCPVAQRFENEIFLSHHLLLVHGHDPYRERISVSPLTLFQLGVGT